MADIKKLIKALEQCVKNVSCEGCPYYFIDKECQMRNDALELLKGQRITGHWIPFIATADHNGVRVTSFKCSECGERTDRVDTDRHINFCPMCGAKMLEA